MLRAGLLFLVISAVVGKEVRELSVEGVIEDRDCLDGSCGVQPSGPNVKYCHGDESQSCLYVFCNLDSVTLTLESPPSTWYSSFRLTGHDGKSTDDICLTENYWDDGILKSDDLKAGYGLPTVRWTKRYSYESCGFQTVLIEDGQPCGKLSAYSNTVRILEFVHPYGPLSGKRQNALYLTSETIVKIQCSNNPGSPIAECPAPPPPPPLPPITDCNEKQFDFNCGVNTDNERFGCIVKLRDGQSLGTNDVRFYVDSCLASIAGYPSSQQLYGNRLVTNELEVQAQMSRNPGSPDRDEFRLRTAYFIDQFQPNKCPVPITIDCTVKFARADNVGALDPSSASNPAISASSFAWNVDCSQDLISSPLIKAGKLTLVK